MSKSHKTSKGVDISIENSKVQHILRIVIPVSYSIGKESYQKDFQLVIDSTFPDYSALKEIIQKKNTDHQEVNLDIQELLRLESTIIKLEDFVHGLLKERYIEEVN